jgi:hypothetical protein
MHILEAQAIECSCLGIVDDLGAMEDDFELLGEAVLGLRLWIFDNDIESLAESSDRMILGWG